MNGIKNFFIPNIAHSLKYNKALDGLRGVAISFVFIFHIFPDCFSFGYVGVDIFFVLSGYLITKIIYTNLDRGTFTFISFYRNRIRRIFPAMIVVVFSTFVLGYLFLFPTEFQSLLKHLKSSLFFYQNFRLIDEVGYWDVEASLKPMLHFWSLSIEEQFYIVWPLVIIAIHKIKLNIFKSMLSVFIGLALLSQIINVDDFYHSLSRFWELSFGGLIFAIEYKRVAFKTIKKQSYFPFLFFIFTIVVSLNNEHFSFYKTFLITLSTGIIILTLDNENFLKKILSSDILVFLGLISFPLYLWHYVVISFYHILKLDIYSNILSIILIPIILSFLTFKFFEVYSRRQTSYKFALYLFFISLSMGLFFQYANKSKIFITRSHMNINLDFEKQFKKGDHKNQNGIDLTTKIVGSKISNHYILSSSSSLDKKYILIIGDSHAFASYDGFKKVFSNNGFETVMIANSNCPPYIGGALGVTIEKANECKQNIENIYNFIDKSKDIVEKVLIVSRGEIYISDYEFGDIEDAKKPKGNKYLEYFDETKYNRSELFFDSLDKTMNYLNEKFETYFLLENPELGYSPRNYMNRPIIGGAKDDKMVKFDKKKYLDRQGAFTKKVENLSSKYENVQLLYSESIFCDDLFCYSVKDGKMLYRDDDHLSFDGALYQAKQLEKLIFKD